MDVSPREDNLTPELLSALADWHSEATILAAESKAAFGKYVKYETLIEHVKPALTSHGLWCHQRVLPCNGGVAVETIIYGHGGNLSGGIVRVPSAAEKADQYGAAYTYAKRFSLVLALGIGGDKDEVEHKIAYKVDEEEASPEPAPEKDDVETMRKIWDECGLDKSKNKLDAKKRFAKYQATIRNHGLEHPQEAFTKWLEDKFNA